MFVRFSKSISLQQIFQTLRKFQTSQEAIQHIGFILLFLYIYLLLVQSIKNTYKSKVCCNEFIWRNLLICIL